MIDEGKYTVLVDRCSVECDEKGKPNRVHFHLVDTVSGVKHDDRVLLTTPSGPNICREKMMVLGFTVPRGKDVGEYAASIANQVGGREVEINVQHKINKRGKLNIYCFYQGAAPEVHASAPQRKYPEFSADTERMLRQTGG